MNFFHMDSWFGRIGAKVFDFLILSLLTLVISLFSATLLLGPALTAFFYAIDKVVVHDRGYLIKNYFSSFKENLLKAVALGVIIIVGYGLVGWIMYYGSDRRMVLVALYFAIIELTIIVSYCFVLLAKFHMSLGEIISKSLLYGHKHLATTLVIVSVVLGVAWLTVYVHPSLMIIAMGPGGYVISRLVLERVVIHYIEDERLLNGESNEGQSQ